ncbi:hypothetical protein [Microbacterium sp. BH-3-3-3]|uniref:hypothetical protein n=1 Tax=Microbacterium sp. BH-3-3-3 TaxID=1906742 RepID=UPI00119EBA87|nr:hypothetical protein [Microbacterium sp. BH-3-3-3]
MTLETPLAPTPDPSPQPPRRGAAFAVSVVTIAVGACIALGTLAGTGASAVVSLRDTGENSSVLDSGVEGLTDVDIDVAAGALTIAYGDVSEARLDADREGPRGWRFDRRRDTLRVSSPEGPFAGVGTGSRATLTLPRELEGSGIRASIDVTGGSLDLDGDFGALSVQLAGGAATLRGSAAELDVSVSGGAATARVDDVSTASFEVAGGDLTAELGGLTPDRTKVDVTAGSADITLPDDDYRVNVDDGLGRVDNALRTDASATARVDVQATMGQVRLHS